MQLSAVKSAWAAAVITCGYEWRLAANLVVDDEPVIRHTLTRALEPLGRMVLRADSVGAAKELTQSSTIDVAVVDKNLPDGSGIDFIRKLRSQQPEAEALLITAYDTLDSALDAIHARVFDYIRKPFDIFHVQDQVRAALGSPRSLEMAPGSG